MSLPPENKRVKDIIKYVSNGNILAFSRDIGISQPRIARLFTLDKRNNKYPLVSFEIIQSIINKFIDIDAEWLLTGNGTMLKKRNMQKKRHFKTVAQSVAKSVQNETYKKSDTFEEDIVSEPAAPYGISRNNNNYVITLLEENKKLVEEKNAYLEKENKRLIDKIAKLTNENKQLTVKIANLQAQNKEQLSNQQPLKKEVST